MEIWWPIGWSFGYWLIGAVLFLDGLICAASYRLKVLRMYIVHTSVLTLKSFKKFKILVFQYMAVAIRAVCENEKVFFF